MEGLIKSILKEMGVDESQPPHWIQHMHKVKDQTTGELIHEIKDGYTCSYCGKHSYWKKEKCDGCNSIMREEKDNE